MCFCKAKTAATKVEKGRNSEKIYYICKALREEMGSAEEQPISTKICKRNKKVHCNALDFFLFKRIIKFRYEKKY